MRNVNKIIQDFEVHKIYSMITESSDPEKLENLKRDLLKHCKENDLDFNEICKILKIDTGGLGDVDIKVLEILEKSRERWYGSGDIFEVKLRDVNVLDVRTRSGLKFNYAEGTNDLKEIFKKYRFGVVTGGLNLRLEREMTSDDLRGKLPEEIKGSFRLSGLGIDSLEGVFPQKVSDSVHLSSLKLENLSGCIEKINGTFEIRDMKPESGTFSLKGGPKEVEHEFTCYNSPLSSFEGSPEKIGRGMSIQYTQLGSFAEGNLKEFGSKFVNLDLSHNNLFSLEGIPLDVNSSGISCNKNIFPPAVLKEVFNWAKSYGNWIAAYLKLSTTTRFKRMGKSLRDPIRDMITPDILKKNTLYIAKIWGDEEIMGDPVVARLIKKSGIKEDPGKVKDIETKRTLDDLGF